MAPFERAMVVSYIGSPIHCDRCAISVTIVIVKPSVRNNICEIPTARLYLYFRGRPIQRTYARHSSLGILENILLLCAVELEICLG